MAVVEAASGEVTEAVAVAALEVAEVDSVADINKVLQQLLSK